MPRAVGRMPDVDSLRGGPDRLDGHVAFETSTLPRTAVQAAVFTGQTDPLVHSATPEATDAGPTEPAVVIDIDELRLAALTRVTRQYPRGYGRRFL